MPETMGEPLKSLPENAVLQALMRHVPEGITIAEAPDVLIRMVSDWGVKLTGRTREQVEGIPAGLHSACWGIYHPSGRPTTDDELPLTRATRHGEIIENEEYVIRWDDGTAITILCNAGPIRDDAGRIIGGVIAWRDISALKKMTQELQVAKATLEQRIAQAVRDARIQTEQRAILAEQLVEAEQKERQRLAHVLHDDLQQWLVAAKLQLHTLTSAASAETRCRAAADLEQYLDSAINESRTLASDLAPPTLERMGLIQMLQLLADRFSQRYHLTVDLTAPSPAPPLDNQRLVLLYHILRELLFNVVKHARCPRAVVRVECQNQVLQAIVIEDQGAGFDPAALSERTGSGLLSIQQRLQALGGSLEIHSQPARGSRLTIRLPAQCP